MDFELVAEGLQFPEGPVAMADGSVLVTEIRGGRITRVHPDGRTETVVETGGGPNGLAIGPDGALYICNNGGRFTWIDIPGAMYPADAPPEHRGGSIQRLDLATGKLTTLYDNCEGQPLWAPNDLVFDKTGGFWFTDHSRDDHKTAELRRPLLRPARWLGHPTGAQPHDLVKRGGPVPRRDRRLRRRHSAGTAMGLRPDRARPDRQLPAGATRAASSPTCPAFSWSTAWRWRPAARSAWRPSSTAGSPPSTLTVRWSTSPSPTSSPPTSALAAPT